MKPEKQLSAKDIRELVKKLRKIPQPDSFIFVPNSECSEKHLKSKLHLCKKISQGKYRCLECGLIIYDKELMPMSKETKA